MDVRGPEDLRAAEGETTLPEVKAAPKEKARYIFEEEPQFKKRFPWKSVIASVVILAVFGGGFYFFSFYKDKKEMVRQAEESLNDSGLAARFNLPGGNLEIRNLSDVSTKLLPLLKGGFGAYKGLAQAASAWARFTTDASVLKKNLLLGITNGESGDLLGPLKALQGDLSALNQASDSIDFSNSGLQSALGILPSDYLALKYQMRFWEQGLGSLSNWLSSDRRAVVFLQNSSEIRPTGGFWGSFAEINFKGGKISGIEVRDISEVDRTLDLKTIPPKPLQALVTNWRTADSNWFFNFPDSARKASEFMAASKLYGDEGARADMIAAVSPAFVSDILGLTGPISVSSTKAVIDKDNFLPSIQAEVQKGHDVGSREAKNVLKELYAGIAEKFSALDADAEGKLLGIVLDRAASKDLVLWAEDDQVESMFAGQHVDGALFEIPQRFNGDYLGVAAANIGGAKSDYVIRQKVSLESQLSLDGSVKNHLEVARYDAAKRSDSWWYRTPNQAYMRVYLSPIGKLQGAKGGFQKTVYAPINYKAQGYSVDPAVAAVESTASSADGYPWLTLYEESGKTVLGAWQKVSPGATSTLAYDYTHRLFLDPAEGVVYEFVLDKQPGVNSSYDLSFTAPVGFVWKENNSPVFDHSGSDIPGRLTIKLTLAKAP